jgi:hypothetical protein
VSSYSKKKKFFFIHLNVFLCPGMVWSLLVLNGISSFRGMVQKEITSSERFFSSTKWRNGLERNSELFLSAPEWLGTEFRAFSVPRNSRNSDGTNQNFYLFRVLRSNFFLRVGMLQ